MVKTRRTTDGIWMVECPACGNCHGFDSRWTFDGNVDQPTFAPSMLVGGGSRGSDYRCHSFVRDGKIQYLDDCTHELKGQTVELPEWD